ncbi:mycothione reductase [Actinospongicola halichondriae]|uniref:mycothione reductase n=1 Tax=Actinospongicola halichondriae TaxID=3236844 RepID=UPI003D57DE48
MNEFDLVIVGTGSGNSIPSELDDWNIALVERDVFGGTCLNRGCIPSKMFIYAADVALHVRESGRFGVRSTLDGFDWPDVVDRVFGRIDPIAASGERYRIEDCDNITVFQGNGTFVDHKVLEVNGERLHADKFILGAGARPFVPDIPGLAEAGFHTSDSIMRVREVPERLVVIGGGYIATELGHVFEAFGAQVSIVNRSGFLLRSEDEDISRRYTELASERFALYLDSAIERVDKGEDGVTRVQIRRDGETIVLEANALLVATGRIPNSDQLQVETTGVTCDPAGRVITHDDHQTDVEGIWAFGDLSNHFQLKHVANAEAKMVFHNVAHPDDLRLKDEFAVPHAVFGSPQVASVGMTERDAAAEGVPFITTVKDYGTTAYGWAMDDSTSFVKLVAHAQTRKLLGAHIIGPQASTLIQLLIQGMRFGQTVDEMAHGQMWVHPALTEVLENALLDL